LSGFLRTPWLDLADRSKSTTCRGCLERGRLPATKAEQAGPYQQGTLFKLAVFAAPAIEPDVRRTAITSRLTHDAGSCSGQRPATRLRYFVTAFHAVGLSFTGGHACSRSHHLVRDSIVDLILHRPVWSPPARHCRNPTFLASEGLDMGITMPVSKPVHAEQHGLASFDVLRAAVD
jgi:hypothetical protein